MTCKKCLEFSVFFIMISVIRTRSIVRPWPVVPRPPLPPIDPVEPPRPPTVKTTIVEGSLEHPLDLAFIIDSTGSMASYINAVKQNINLIVEEIVKRSQSKVRLALIEYRDHPPQERSFVTRAHDFTESVSNMKSWLNNAAARGGGDTPEAVADALNEATKLSWNQESTKISILISDAPPHALDPSRDSSFHNGCPKEYDPMESVRELAKIGVTLYSVGCEPSINLYKDFFEALAFMTGGQYVPMRDPGRLINVIIGGAEEEISIQQFSNEVEKEFERVIEGGGKIDQNEIAANVYRRLKAEGVKSKQLTKNNKTLKGPSVFAKELSNSVSMSGVKNKFVKKNRKLKTNTRKHGIRRFEKIRGGMRFDRRRMRPTGGRTSGFGGRSPDPIAEMPVLHSMGSLSSRMSYPKRRMYSPKSAYEKSSSDTYSTTESEIKLDQIKRLVKKVSSKLEAS